MPSVDLKLSPTECDINIRLPMHEVLSQLDSQSPGTLGRLLGGYITQLRLSRPSAKVKAALVTLIYSMDRTSRTQLLSALLQFDLAERKLRQKKAR